MGHTPDDDGREVFGAVLTEPLAGGDFVMRRAREDDLPAIMSLVDDVMRTRLMLPSINAPGNSASISRSSPTGLA